MGRELPLRTLWAALGLALAVAACYLFLDRLAAGWAASLKHSGTFGVATILSLLADSGATKHLVAAGFVLSAANLLGASPRPWARKLLFVCLSVTVAFLVTDALKYVFGRARPPLFLEEGVYGFTWFTDKDAYNSFPSGHTTRAFAACAALAFLFRRYAVPFFCIAALVGLSRIFALRHYPSDVLAGAFVGIAAAVWTRALYRSGPAS